MSEAHFPMRSNDGGPLQLVRALALSVAAMEFPSSVAEVRGGLDGVGGGRGVFAKQAIAPGTLVLREQPLVVPDDKDPQVRSSIGRVVQGLGGNRDPMRLAK